jgi:molybdate transport system substrate-binding protein
LLGLAVLMAGLVVLLANLPAKAAPEKTTLVLFVGSATKPPMLEARSQFEKSHPDIALEMMFGGSGTLLNQMVLEKTGDIYVPGSDDYMDRAEKQKAVIPGTRKIVAYLVPVMLVARGNPKQIRSLKDLARPRVKVGLARAGAVCLGDVADQVLRSAGIESQVKKNVITYAGSCEQTEQLIELGEVDAIIGWDSFKAWAPTKLDVVRIPGKYLRVRNVPAAVAAYSKHRAEGQELIKFLTSKQGKAIFAKHGYSVKPPKI